MIVLAYIAAAIAAGLAYVVAQQRRAMRPVAWLLAWEVAQDLGRRALSTCILDPARATLGTPYVGWARVAFHAREALQVSWCFGVVAVAARVLLGRLALWAAPAFLVAVAVAVSGYPWWLRGATALDGYYAVVQAVEVAACGAYVVSFVRRGEGTLSIAHVAVFWLVAVELAVLAAYAVGGIFEWWPVASSLYLAMHTGLVLAQGWWLWTSAPRESQS